MQIRKQNIYTYQGDFFIGFASELDEERESVRCIKTGIIQIVPDMDQRMENCSSYEDDCLANEIDKKNLNYNNWATSQLVTQKAGPSSIHKDELYKPFFKKFR